MRAAFGVLLITLATVAPAWAQSGTGVSAVLVGDIARYDGVTSGSGSSNSRNGEALGFALRLDRALGSRWGVELEYVRGGEIETESRLIPLPAADFPRSLSSAVASFSFTSLSEAFTQLRAPTTTINRARLSTVSTLAWYRQSIGDRTSLVYSGGVAFGISENETTYSFVGFPEQLILPPTTNEYTNYSVHPIVGFDARIAMTDHASLVPGVRVLGAEGGILVRPSVGLRWEF